MAKTPTIAAFNEEWTNVRVTTTASRGRLQARLDDLLTSRFTLQSRQARITRTAELPASLESCARNLAPDCEWRAHTTGDEVFFAIARSRPCRPVGASAATLDVYFLDVAARVYSAGVWEHEAQRGWWLDSVLVPSYDTEHGWWLADVVRADRTWPAAAMRNAVPALVYEPSSP
jgi:hypothetical protein